MTRIVQLPSASKETPSHLTQLITTTLESISAFKALHLPVDSWDAVLVYLLQSKLAPETNKEWVKTTDTDPNNTSFPKFEDFRDFIQRRIREASITSKTGVGSNSADIKEASKFPHHSKAKASTSSPIHVSPTTTYNKSRRPVTKRCKFCQQNHSISYCNQFVDLPVVERRSFVKNNNLCFNCMGQSHSANDCPVKFRCLVCGKPHHSRLHLGDNEDSGIIPVSSSAVIAVTNGSPAKSTPVIAERGILATALVLLENAVGQNMSVRALLDPCAEECIVSDHVAKFLRLPRKNDHVVLTGAGGHSTAVATYRSQVTLKSKRSENFAMEIRPLILSKVSSLIPPNEIPLANWEHLKDLPLADPYYGIPSRVDCVLGSFVYGQIILPEIRRDPHHISYPVAMNTRFGWVLVGASSPTKPVDSQACVHLTINAELSRAVERFWEIEDVSAVTKMSPADEQCYRHFKSTHFRDSSGRFVVQLPFIKQPSLVGTKRIAFKCLQRLESRLKRDRELAQRYTAFLDEYESLGHLRQVPDSSDGVYLPHHPVWKKDGSKKIRVVFNASQDDTMGNSLNSFLHSGPKLQLDIFTVLCRWAFFKHVFTCDIIKMFRQFELNPSDCHWQRILWRTNPAEPVRHLELSTVTYGTTSAPFLANACMLELADSADDSFLSASEIIRKHRYVDDFFGGADTIEEAESVRANLLSLMRTARLETDKLKMNYGSSTEERFIDISNNENPEQNAVSLLGLSWDPISDSYRYKFHVVPMSKISKRTILSMIARLYDPVGWISPIVLRAKLIMQTLWLHGVDWDTPTPEPVANAWIQYYHDLSELSNVQIPRWVQTESNVHWEIQGFADASQRAYAAAVYIVAVRSGKRISTLLTSKSKVSPVKSLSVPRLELCAAHLLAKLIESLKSVCKEQPQSITCWSDSKNVLSWLASHPSRWQTFVANRVSEIRSLLPEATWQYVRTGDNPADLASRGCSPAELRDSVLWWKGPVWLESDPESWNVLPCTSIEITEERKKGGISSVWFLSVVNGEFIEWIQRFSSSDKIIATWAYCLRWFTRIRKDGPTPSSLFLTAEELRISRFYILKHLQEGDYPDERNQLKANNYVSSASPLKRLGPFLDEYGVMRVGGRLQHSILREEARHPAILSASNHFSELLIRRAHKLTMHGGVSVVLSFLGQQYWIVRGWNVVRKVVHSCTVCLRHNARCQEQQMAPLPIERVTPSRPFTFTGLDYAGPFLLRKSPGRGMRAYKGYIAIFICLTVKAVHLELVSDLSTAAFLAALRRFIARRGLPRTIFSDNGTNFQGAANEIQRLFSPNSALRQEAASQAARDGIQWKFIPPRAPHFGGLWEGNIRVLKRHLARAMGNTTLTYEEFSTILVQVESCLNSRPLYPISSDGSDPSVLTPGHFLIGDTLLSLPEGSSMSNENSSYASRWKMLQQLTAFFWKRWRTEYLCHLQRRVKWLKPQSQLKVGDLVLIRNILLPPSQWPLGRISALHPGKDGLTRVATVKTSSSELLRAIHHLIVILPEEESTPNSRSDMAS